MKPLEVDYYFERLYNMPCMARADFTAKPMVLLSGQYSVGKSTFIRFLIERDYPGLRIGPEPTTDKWVAIMGGPRDQVIPGNAVIVDPSLPFTRLNKFGTNFFDRLEASICKSDVLETLTFIDTPGVLSGEKQRLNRGYDYEQVYKWFVQRCDKVLLMFDAHKLDISDEFKRNIECLKGHPQKVAIILNKADRVNTSQLMRIYGALMWSLGKVLNTPEVARIYIGTFWDQPLHFTEMRNLFESEANDLYNSLAILSKDSALRQLNELIKRARNVRASACILHYMRSELPTFGRDAKAKKLIDNLPNLYAQIATKFNLPQDDLPNSEYLQKKLRSEAIDLKKLPSLGDDKFRKRLQTLDELLNTEIPKLIKMLPQEMAEQEPVKMPFLSTTPSPFAVDTSGGLTGDAYRFTEWLKHGPDIALCEDEFNALNPEDGLLNGAKAKKPLQDSNLQASTLHQIWTLSDVDKDGCLDLTQFAIAKHLIAMKLDQQELPKEIPAHWMQQPAGHES